MNERPLFDRSLAKFLSAFPHDPETAKALLLHAQLCKERGDIKQSLDDLHTLLYHFPEHEGRQGILYDIALYSSLIKIGLKAV